MNTAIKITTIVLACIFFHTAIFSQVNNQNAHRLKLAYYTYSKTPLIQSLSNKSQRDFKSSTLISLSEGSENPIKFTRRIDTPRSITLTGLILIVGKPIRLKIQLRNDNKILLRRKLTIDQNSNTYTLPNIPISETQRAHSSIIISAKAVGYKREKKVVQSLIGSDTINGPDFDLKRNYFIKKTQEQAKKRGAYFIAASAFVVGGYLYRRSLWKKFETSGENPFIFYRKRGDSLYSYYQGNIYPENPEQYPTTSFSEDWKLNGRSFNGLSRDSLLIQTNRLLKKDQMIQTSLGFIFITASTIFLPKLNLFKRSSDKKESGKTSLHLMPEVRRYRTGKGYSFKSFRAQLSLYF